MYTHTDGVPLKL